MSVDTYVTTGIGVRVKWPDLLTACTTTTEEPPCPHQEALNQKFCPECGAKNVKKTTKKLGKGLSENVEYDNHRFLGIDVRHDSHEAEPAWAFILPIMAKESSKGRYSNGAVTFLPLEPGEIEKAMLKLREALMPLGLWKPEDFGVWTVWHRS